jgi:hypothetical protein
VLSTRERAPGKGRMFVMMFSPLLAADLRISQGRGRCCGGGEHGLAIL